MFSNIQSNPEKQGRRTGDETVQIKIQYFLVIPFLNFIVSLFIKYNMSLITVH